MVKIITDPNKIDEILDRGTIVQILPTKREFRDKLLSGKKMRFYIGFDATSPSLHLSHAKNFILMEKFRKLGHEVIILFGDFTAMIGDPTGEDSTRKQLTREEVINNVKKWKKIIRPLMNFTDRDNPAKIMYNHRWLSRMSLEDIVGVARHFTVQQMIARDMFQKRLREGKPIYMHEFLYPLMQGYDSVFMDVDVEVCGQDQIFNALVGRTLLKQLKGKDKYIVALTLMENPKTGELMSKSKGIGVFLDVSPNDLYGQIMAQPDEMTEILFVNNTLLPLEEINDIMRSNSPSDAKMRLAFEITKIFHGAKKAKKAEDYFVKVIQQKQYPDKTQEIKIQRSKISIIDLLLAVGFAKSRSDARRLISQGAIKIDGKAITIAKDLTVSRKGFMLQKGPMKFVKVYM